MESFPRKAYFLPSCLMALSNSYRSCDSVELRYAEDASLELIEN